MGDPYKFRCVKVSGQSGYPETQKLMDEALKCLKDEQLEPEHFTEKECFDVVKKEKNVVYMFDVFEGEAFKHIVDLGCRAYGPMCILTCVSCNQNIPRGGRSVYNLAMKDVVVCCTNLDSDKRQFIHEKVEWMGGNTRKDFTQDVTHLVAGSVGSKKYQLYWPKARRAYVMTAAGCGLQIMTVEWVDDVWKKSMIQAAHCTDEQFQVHRCPIFLGCVVTVSGLLSEERKEVKRLIEREGGRYSGEMSMKESTHLIINEPKGQKYLFALKWNILIVKTEWLYESIEKGFCQDEVGYKLVACSDDNKGRMKTSTPERQSLPAGGIGDISNISMISMVAVNETKFNSTTMTTMMEDQEPIEHLDLTKPATELFLDGCKIYLSGFRGASLEKLRKVINIGGGTRFNQITDNLTHVVIGERIDRDIEQIKGLSIRPQTVTSQWICDCYKQETLLDGFNYASRELPIDPTTPKKKEPRKNPKLIEDNQKPSTSKQEVVEMNGGGEDMDDIMSQYLTKPQDPDVTSKSDNTTLEPDERGQHIPPTSHDDDGDLTQDPNSVTAGDLRQVRSKKILLSKFELENTGIFHKKTLIFLGFEDDALPELCGLVKENGGLVLQSNSRKIPDYAVIPLYGFPIDRTVGDIVTNVWLESCLEQDSLLDCHSNPLFSPIEIQGGLTPLKDCVLSISGYAGTERGVLLHIAEVLGATNQDCFLRIAKNGLLASTQLIVNVPSGSKYQAAKKWGIPAVSKSWLLACAKSGKLEPVENFLIENEAAVSNPSTNSSAPRNNQTDPPNKTDDANRDQHKDLTELSTEAAKTDQCETKNAQIVTSKHGAKSDTPAKHGAKLDTPAKHGAKSDTPAKHGAKLDTPAKHGAKLDTPAKHGAKSDTTPGRTDLDPDLTIDPCTGNNSKLLDNDSKVNGPDFSATGDTEALLMGFNTQGEQNPESGNNKSDELRQQEDIPDDIISDKQCVNDVGEESVPKCVQNRPQEKNVQSEMVSEDVCETEAGSETVSVGARNRLLAMPPVMRNWRVELRKQELEDERLKLGSSQKENMVNRSTPVQGRVKELRTQQGSTIDKDTPSKFLNPKVKYIPKFDVEDLLKTFETPEAIRAARAKRRRSSIPFDELFDQKMAQAEQKLLKAKERKLQESQGCQDEVDRDSDLDIGILQGVIISVARKLAKDQSDLNELVSSLGGDYRWNYDKSCTHFIFQGRQNDTAKDFKMARNQCCAIVHPHWLYMCKEQNVRVEESLYPHTFNPNLSLSVVTSKRTPLRTPARGTRRNLRERLACKTDESQTKPDPIVIPDDVESKTKTGTEKVATPKLSSRAEESPVLKQKRSPAVINLKQTKEDLDKSSSDEDGRQEGCDDVTEVVQGGSLEMREMLSRQLENVMAESKGKKRRRSKRLNCSGGQAATPEENTSSRSLRRTQDGSTRTSSRTSKSVSEPEKPQDEKGSMEMATSQSVQVVWDDPMGRMEQEKLAHKLERACSPTQDTNTFYDADPEDAQYSESDGETEIPVPPFEKQTEEKTTPKADKAVSNKTPTPEGPSIAFPTNSKMDRITPPKPVMMTETDEPTETLPPVIMLSGVSAAERNDYGVLVEKLGGKVIDSQHFDPRCTHLVINNITRSEKLLASIAAGKWVLHKSYLEACRQENTFVEEEFYEWGSQGTLSLVKNLDSNIRQLTVAARDWRVKVQTERNKPENKCGAFCTWRVILCCDENREGNYKRLLEAGGATVLNNKPPFTETIDATHVLMELHKVSLSQEDLEMLLTSECLCLKPEFICAHLSDPKVDTQKHTPAEIIALKTVLSDSSENTRKRRKASTGDLPVKRSKRR